MAVQAKFCGIVLKCVIFLYLFVFDIQCSLISPVPISETDITHSNKFPVKVQIPQEHKIPFYGSLYSSIWICNTGIISFDENKLCDDLENLGAPDLFLPTDFPEILAYFYDGERPTHSVQLSQSLGTKISYQELNKLQQSDEGMLLDLNNNLTEAFVGYESSDISYGLIVTWYNVTEKDQVAGGCGTRGDCKTSTFQVAILTDNKITYLILNYDRMGFSQRRQKAGFNGGYGRGWTPTLTDWELSNMNTGVRGSDMEGRFYYKIQDENVVRGGCIAPGVNGQTVMSPTYAGMYGGEVLQVSGECLSESSQPKCRFADKIEVTGYKINNMKFQCVVPRLTRRGLVDVETSVDNGRRYRSKGQLYIVHPARMPALVSFPDGGRGWNETHASSLTIKWNSQMLSDADDARVSIALIGYEETRNGPNFPKFNTVGTNILNKLGTYTFDTTSVSCFGSCNSEIINVEISVGSISKAYRYMRMVSAPMPSGWFVNQNRIQTYGTNWPSAMCSAWYSTDKQDMAWLTQLEYCPCNLWQAISDIGRWQPDVGCDMFHGSKCTYHIGAKHCVRAVQPTKETGSGNQCCYDPDGSLRYAADSFQGSTPDKSHDWGAFPYDVNGRVPVLSHWLKDVVTFYYCCLWTGYDDCDKYMDLRATRDCNGYKPPVPAMIYGLAHVGTFGGSHFHICAEGDYILAEQPSGFMIQGRFLLKPVGASNKTLTLRSIAVKVNQEVIEVKVKPASADRTRHRIDVIVNGQYSFFDDKPIFWKDYSEMAIVNNVHGTTNTQSNVTIILKNGIGIQVAESNDILEALLMVPASLQGTVTGLLGQLGQPMDKDLVPRGTNTSVTFDNESQLFHNFLVTWRLNDSSEHIIPYRPEVRPLDVCQSHGSFSNAPFCEGNKECEFDYARTRNEQIAKETRRSDIRLSQLRTYLKPVRSCGLLNVDKAIRSNHNYTLGSTVTLTGCKKGLSLGGATNVYTCAATQDGNQAWSPTVASVCRVDLEPADIGMIVGIVVGVLVLIVIVVVLICCYVRRSGKRKGSKQEASSEYPGKSDEGNPASSGHYDARYSEVKTKDEEAQRGGMGKRVPSKELTV